MAFNRKAKLRDNIEAVRTVFTLEKERRAATPQEREVLSRYCGFSGLKFILNPASNVMDAAQWAKSDRELFPMTAELHRLIRENSADEREYKRYFDSLKSSVLTAFYTPPEIVSAIAGTLHEHGIVPNRLLDPSARQGVFISAFGADAPGAEVMAFDKDLLTGKILSHLYPEHKVRAEGFEKIEKPFMGTFDVVTSNIPFGDVAVFDPEYTGVPDNARRTAAKSIHNYFFLKGLDAAREGGIVAFITSEGVLNSPKNELVRRHIVKNANIVSVVRLPNNLFTDHAGTEVGSDLVILQKDTTKNRELSGEEKRFVRATDIGDGIIENEYTMSVAPLRNTKMQHGTDPYGKPALLTIHQGGIQEMGEDLKEHLDIAVSANLNIDLYNRYRQGAPVVKQETEKPAAKETIQSEPEVKQEPAAGQEPPRPEKREEKPEITPPVIDLYDLFNFSREERRLAQSGLKKKPTGKKPKRTAPVRGRSLFEQPQAQATATNKATDINKVEEKTAQATSPSVDMEQVYAAMDWDTNPPINGFYEAMMGLTPEQRADLREGKNVTDRPDAEKPVHPVADGLEEELRRQEEIKRREEAEKLEAELMKPRPLMAKLEPHHKEGMLVADGNQVGYLKGVTRYGATFHPLELDKAQQDKAELYIFMRDSYQRLYTYEAEMHEENKVERITLNTAYDTFMKRYGNLNAKANVKFLLMDVSGRDMLSLERVENGQFVKADIFDHPVAFALNEVTHVDTPEEALSASLNRYGTVKLDYMESLCDNSRDELVEILKGRIFFNPLVDSYEIKDRFIAGNVVEKMEKISRWVADNKGNGRMPEVEKSLEALQAAMPRPITFDELDFNFGYV